METLFSAAFIQDLLISMIRMATPLLLVALGELYSESAGLVNIGLDGLMTIGACIGFIASFVSGNPWLGILAGAIAGALLNLIFAFSTITLAAGQTINGMALNILAPGLATFIFRMYFGVTTSLKQGPTIPTLNIPYLSDIPFIGKILFSQSPLTFIAIGLVIFTSWFFRKTKPGLNYLAVGENPRAAETMGIKVNQKKYLACLICGALSGVGGAFLTTSYIGAYAEGVVAGRGFIALSAVIFGGWTSWGVLAATMLFGLADAIQLRFQVLYPVIPYQLLAMLPYAATIIALILFSNRSNQPKANGQPYLREGK